MRTGLIVFGVIFLVLGGLLFFLPTQTAKATTTTVAGDESDTRTSYATVSVPLPLTLAVLLIGLVLFILGLALPDSRAPVVHKTETSTTEVKENSELGDGATHKVVHEKHVRHTQEK